MNIGSIRKEYRLQSLLETAVNPDPLQQFGVWWQQAIESEIDEVNAMTLATVNADGNPSARIVLLKDYNLDGFVFFTNYESRKGKDLQANARAALVFFWKELERQVRIEGTVSRISAAANDAYFHSRPEQSQLGAWASKQSSIIQSRNELEEQYKNYETQYAGTLIQRPEYWGGYNVKPELIEFWQGREGRLHDRIQYSKQESGWLMERLSP
jgi:pyridoxamine 5'-phosphate oxidase